MTRNERNAHRLIVGIQKVGGCFVLLQWERFAVIGCWLPRRTRRKIEQLQAEILCLLQESVLANLRGQLVPQAKAEHERPTNGVAHQTIQ